MSIATKNTITNYSVKMVNNLNSNLYNTNQEEANNLLLVKDLNNNLLLNNKNKLNNMVINNSLAEGNDDDEFLQKNQVHLPSYHLEGMEKLPLLNVPTKVRNNVTAAVRKVLVIYTGGTIGMLRSPDGEGLVPIPHMLEKTVRSFPNFHDETFAKSQSGNFLQASQFLILPKTDNTSSRLAYKIMEYDPLLDSSNMTIDDWVYIAKDIKANYEEYDGFVVLHGTDTMAYTASALSFMLENLTKSVIVTGSQIPLFESRSDGKENFLGALIMAGQYVIPEVSLYFGHKLFRGNRTTKVSSDRLNAFDSPNLNPLASLGINIDVDYNNLLQRSQRPFQLNTALNKNVALLRLYPSITAQTVKAFLQAPMEGVVLQTYGAGNFPTNRLDLLKELEDASRRGVIIVNCTQCGHGTVAAIYETGVKTESAGVIPGYDMTCEAALTKLSYVLGRNDCTIEQKREMMKLSLRGELTSPQKTPIVENKEFILEIEPSELESSLPSQGQKNVNVINSRRSQLQNVFVPNERSVPKMESSPSSQTVLNNGRLVRSRHSHELNIDDLSSLIGRLQNRSIMWQMAGIIFAGQLLLMFCLAIVL